MSSSTRLRPGDGGSGCAGAWLGLSLLMVVLFVGLLVWPFTVRHDDSRHTDAVV
jgi:hypothetical protein